MELATRRLLAVAAGCALAAGMGAATAQPGGKIAANSGVPGPTGNAAAPASVTAVSPLSGLALVGVTEIGDNSEAWLVDLNTRQKLSVSPGQSAFGFQVRRVGPEMVVLTRGNQQYILRLGQNSIPSASILVQAPAIAARPARRAAIAGQTAAAGRPVSGTPAAAGAASAYAPYATYAPYAEYPGFVPYDYAGAHNYPVNGYSGLPVGALPYGSAIGPASPYGNGLNQIPASQYTGELLPYGSAVAPITPYGNGVNQLPPGLYPYGEAVPGMQGNPYAAQSLYTPYPALTPGSGITPYGNAVPYPYNTPVPSTAPTGAGATRAAAAAPNAVGGVQNPQTLRRQGAVSPGSTTPAPLSTPQTQRRRSSYGQ